jgi:photosystem II stability/assembly factor-like uncharacterized protein
MNGEAAGPGVWRQTAVLRTQAERGHDLMTRTTHTIADGHTKASTIKQSRTHAPEPPTTQDPIAQREHDDIAPLYAGKKVRDVAQRRLEALKATRRSNAGVMLGTPATPGASNWLPLGPVAIPKGQTYSAARVLVSGRVTAIVAHPTDPLTLYVGAARGGVWKTTDGGGSWSPISDNEVSLAIGALAIAPSAPQTLYAGTGEGNIFYYTQTFPLNSLNESYHGSGVLKTTNGGATWTTQGAAQFTGACFFRITVHPTDPNTAFAATSVGLYRTTDGGTTWVQLTNGLPPISLTVLAATDVVIDSATPTTAYVAFWGDGVYQTTNAAAATPTWTKVTGLPVANISRIALGISPTDPAKVYAYIANGADSFQGLYETVTGGGGATWSAIPVGIAISVYGAYTLNVAVDISTPDIVYLSGVTLYKGVRNAMTNTWTFTDVGAPYHPDNHAFASHPTNNQIIYAGSDGGIYQSPDGGATWSDTINAHLSLAQFEFIDQHPTSDVVVFGGTQDNGTEQFRNSPVFYHAADGDGGCVAIDATTPTRVLHEFYGASPQLSTQGGQFGTWNGVGAGIAGNALFYPLFALDPTNTQNIAFGTDELNLDAAQGTGGWPTKVALPGITAPVSALNYVNSTLIYAASANGEVYRVAFTAGVWTAHALHAAPLPQRWVWDIAPSPTDVNTITLVMAGFGSAHVWRGVVGGGGTNAAWTDISGTAPNRLPDIPVNALAIDPTAATTMYIGTDVGVFRTTTDGASWSLYNDGLPNTAVYDLKLHASLRLLRAATHGRGMWERKLDVAAEPDVSLFVRDNVMDSGRLSPSPSWVPAAYADPLQGVALNDIVYWWQCVDIKVDALQGMPPAYQMNVADVTYLTFESQLAHLNPQRGRVNRVYVQAHNRGIAPAANVTVKILYADATPGLPDLPADFWTAFPGDSVDTTHWKPIGAAQTIPSLTPTRPLILEWDWTPPVTAADHSCMLVVMDSASDPIPAANKVLSIATLVNTERHVGLKNLHVIDPPPTPGAILSLLRLYLRERDDLLRVHQSLAHGWTVGVAFPHEVISQLKASNFIKTPIDAQLREQIEMKLRQHHDGRKYAGLPAHDDLAAFFHPKEAPYLLRVEPGREGGVLSALPVRKNGVPIVLVFLAGNRLDVGSLTIVQETRERVVGGNTFVLRARQPAHPRRPSGEQMRHSR